MMRSIADAVDPTGCRPAPPASLLLSAKRQLGPPLLAPRAGMASSQALPCRPSACTVALTPPPPLSTPPSASAPRLRGHHAQLPFHCQRLLRVSSPGGQTGRRVSLRPVPRPSMGVHHCLHGAHAPSCSPCAALTNQAILQSKSALNRELWRRNRPETAGRYGRYGRCGAGPRRRWQRLGKFFCKMSDFFSILMQNFFIAAMHCTARAHHGGTIHSSRCFFVRPH